MAESRRNGETDNMTQKREEEKRGEEKSFTTHKCKNCTGISSNLKAAENELEEELRKARITKRRLKPLLSHVLEKANGSGQIETSFLRSFGNMTHQPCPSKRTMNERTSGRRYTKKSETPTAELM
ncbi:hypothetical protein PIB30_086265 [Stylosanthes scabra]|uniref:Uncharacterized protein n=1 Tax=Stylosanthes scabra TaxID=79078 RepID=A0ABU6WUC0_9FABA|nr:hypothetical protein [Stylosanthes scabra]